jgi:hypothetical protein
VAAAEEDDGEEEEAVAHGALSWRARTGEGRELVAVVEEQGVEG